MKKDSGIDSIIEKRIKDIDVFLSEIEEVNKNIPLIAKIVSDKMAESIDMDIDIYETEEYKKYSIEAIRLDLLMKEANNILTEVVYILKSATILNVELSDETKKLVESKEYIDQKISATSNNMFIVNKFDKIEEKSKGTFEKYVDETLKSEVVKNMIDAFRTRSTSTD